MINLWHIFSDERHQSHDQNIDIDFFLISGVICHLSIIDIRIEIHFFVCIGK